MKTRDIKRNILHEPFVQDLYEKKVFPTFYDLLILSALVGYKKKRYEPFQKSTQDPIKFHIFESNNLSDFIFIIALLKHNQDISIFKIDSEVDICEPFEFYASGGITVFKNWVKSLGHSTEPQKAIMKGLIQEDFIPKKLEGLSSIDILSGISFL